MAGEMIRRDSVIKQLGQQLVLARDAQSMVQQGYEAGRNFVWTRVRTVKGIAEGLGVFSLLDWTGLDEYLED
jgi:hypothetical protein